MLDMIYNLFYGIGKWIWEMEHGMSILFFAVSFVCLYATYEWQRCKIEKPEDKKDVNQNESKSEKSC